MRSQCKIRELSSFKPPVGNESLHEISTDNGVRVVNFSTVNTLTSQYRKYLYTWTSDGKNAQSDRSSLDG